MAQFTASVKINAVSNLGKVAKQISKNTSKMKKGFEKLTKAIKKASQAFGKFAKRAGLAAVAVTIAMIALVKKVADFGDEIDKTSQKTGILADELQRLQFAARIGGASTQDFNRGVKFLSRAISEAGDGMAEYEDEFDKLGITVRDTNGDLREPVDILYEMADAFSVLEDGGAKSASSMALLGRAGEALIPMLNEGAEGIRTIGQQVEFPITDEMGDDAAEFNDRIQKLTTNVSGLIRNAISPALPILGAYIDKMNDGLIPLKAWIDENIDFGKVLEDIAKWVSELDLKRVFEVSTEKISGVISDLQTILDGLVSVVEFVRGVKNDPVGWKAWSRWVQESDPLGIVAVSDFLTGGGGGELNINVKSDGGSQVSVDDFTTGINVNVPMMTPVIP